MRKGFPLRMIEMSNFWLLSLVNSTTSSMLRMRSRSITNVALPYHDAAGALSDQEYVVRFEY